MSLTKLPDTLAMAVPVTAILASSYVGLTKGFDYSKDYMPWLPDWFRLIQGHPYSILLWGGASVYMVWKFGWVGLVFMVFENQVWEITSALQPYFYFSPLWNWSAEQIYLGTQVAIAEGCLVLIRISKSWIKIPESMVQVGITWLLIFALTESLDIVEGAQELTFIMLFLLLKPWDIQLSESSDKLRERQMRWQWGKDVAVVIGFGILFMLILVGVSELFYYLDPNFFA